MPCPSECGRIEVTLKYSGEVSRRPKVMKRMTRAKSETSSQSWRRTSSPPNSVVPAWSSSRLSGTCSASAHSPG